MQRRAVKAHRDGRAHSWLNHRVSVVVYDSYHNLDLISTFMPVRLKERKAETDVYEGPINALFDTLKQRHPDILADKELLGVLYANRGTEYEGRIEWVVSSEVGASEAGSDRLVPAEGELVED